MIFRLNLFWKELFLFALTLFIGIFSAYNYTPLIDKSIIEPKILSWNDIVLFITFFVILSFIFFKFKRFGGFLLKAFLVLVVFSGSQIILGSLISTPWDLFLALVITAIFILVRSVIVHDVAVMLGIAGVSSILGITISPQTAVILLVVLSFYDIIAVYWTKHMVYLAKGMIDSGAIFGFMIPFDLKDIFHHKHEARSKIGDRFMILGSGDIGLPLIMASSVAVASIGQAVIVALFSLVGLLFTHLIFINQVTRKPMAALPPIATMTIVGYLVSSLI